jgi:hypothetical protein
MFTSRKRVVNRNDRTKRRKGHSGSAVMTISIIFVSVWILLMLGFVISYVKNENAMKGPAASVQEQLKNAASKKVAFPRWGRRNVAPVVTKRRSNDDEEEDESAVPEGGAIHKPNLLPLSENADAYRSPILIFTCRRQQYLSQTLDDILSNIGDHCAFGCPVVVSEDGKLDLSCLTKY